MTAPTELTVLTNGINGGLLLTEATADTTNGNSFKNTGKTVFVVSNEDASNAIVPSLLSPANRFGQTVTKSLSIAAGRLSIFGPFDPSVWNDSSGLVQVTYTGTSSAARVFAVELT